MKQENMDEKRYENDAIEICGDLIGIGATCCAGLVLGYALEMVPIPAAKPAVEVGFRIGKGVIGGAGAAVVGERMGEAIKQVAYVIRDASKIIKISAHMHEHMKEELEKEQDE